MTQGEQKKKRPKKQEKTSDRKEEAALDFSWLEVTPAGRLLRGLEAGRKKETTVRGGKTKSRGGAGLVVQEKGLCPRSGCSEKDTNGPGEETIWKSCLTYTRGQTKGKENQAGLKKKEKRMGKGSGLCSGTLRDH